jgi:hypothetical protein
VSTRIVTVDGAAADAAWKQFLADIEQANPAMQESVSATIPTPIIKQMLRTAFYVGFESGETNALSKNQS